MFARVTSSSVASSVAPPLGEAWVAEVWIDPDWYAGMKKYGDNFDVLSCRILNPDGTINRSRLGRIIFSDPERRAILESILHPLIRKEEANLVELLADTGQGRF